LSVYLLPPVLQKDVLDKEAFWAYKIPDWIPAAEFMGGGQKGGQLRYMQVTIGLLKIFSLLIENVGI